MPSRERTATRRRRPTRGISPPTGTVTFLFTAIEESALLPVQITGSTLVRMEISTWRTDAGDLDVLADIPDREGRHMHYQELVDRATELDLEGIMVRVASLDDVIASKEWANRPKDRDALPELRLLRPE